MTKKVRHLLGISGGKDSAALAIYMKTHYPEIKMEYYFCDTGKELDETYELITELETFLGQKIIKLEAASGSNEDPFDHYLKLYGGYLPSNLARWCTKNLKLEPFEKFVGNDYAISYVAIRGDEEREGYVSTKPNIQTIFPFRKNIWSIEVLNNILHNSNIDRLHQYYSDNANVDIKNRALEIILEPTSKKLLFSQKLYSLLDLDIVTFNNAVFQLYRNSEFPIAQLADFTICNNSDIIVKKDVRQLFTDNGVTFPGYYKEVEFELNGEVGKYARSRSGCFFCFYQQKIEWIWLYERHPHLFKKAMEYEKDGFTWGEDERLEDLIKPERMNQIKEDHLTKLRNKLDTKSNKLVDILDDSEGISCVNCFI